MREFRCRKFPACLLVGVGLCVGYWYVCSSTCLSSPHFPTVLKDIATLLTLMVGVMPLVRYLSVKDNTILFIGIGFDAKQGSRIFEMFQRLHNRAIYAGTDVGLAMFRHIVQCNWGMIEAEGRPGEGATFRERLPPLLRPVESVDEAA
ncbi:MAG: hypothetical protein O7I42_13055 [Alphaproteobacteria bacterium]|nr:hypothetical protein [Alphaproteobacteria bacterium]